MIYAEQLEPNDHHRLSIDISESPAGIYLVRFVSENNIIVKKAMKQ